MNKKEYLEVETPILQPLYGGAAARPFKTHHNTLDTDLYLRIANELYLKRLIVGGFDGVYEFSKDFRNEGMSRFHNPEFTQMELYVAYKDYDWMMDLVEEMVEKIALDLHGKTDLQVGDNIIDFKRPWKRQTMYESILDHTGVDISKMNELDLIEVAKIANASPKSPTLLTINAFIAAELAEGFLYQNPINKYEARPTPSHPKNNCKKLSETTKTNIEKVKSDK